MTRSWSPCQPLPLLRRSTACAFPQALSALTVPSSTETLRRLALDFGVPTCGRSPTIVLVCATRTCRRSRSTSAHRRPRSSPRLMPVVASALKGARARRSTPTSGCCCACSSSVPGSAGRSGATGTLLRSDHSCPALSDTPRYAKIRTAKWAILQTTGRTLGDTIRQCSTGVQDNHRPQGLRA